MGYSREPFLYTRLAAKYAASELGSSVLDLSCLTPTWSPKQDGDTSSVIPPYHRNRNQLSLLLEQHPLNQSTSHRLQIHLRQQIVQPLLTVCQVNFLSSHQPQNPRAQTVTPRICISIPFT